MTRREFLRNYFPELAAAAAVLIAFGWSLSFGFQTDWDDGHYILSNSRLGFTMENLKGYLSGGPLGLWTPFTMYSLMLDHLVWGKTAAFGYRLTNLLLQCGAAVLFVRILRILGLRGWLALVCGLCWAVHPQRLESVVWIAERKDVLSGVFALGALYVFMKGPEKIPNLLGACVLFVCSFFSKPSTVGVPLVCAVYLCYARPEKYSWRILAAGGAGMLAACGFIAWIMNFHPNFESPEKILSIVPHNIFFYTANTVFPLEVNPCYPHVDWLDWWIAPAFALLVLGMVLAGRRAGLSAGFLWGMFGGFGIVFCAFFAPTTGAIRFNPTDYADRYSYLPSLAVWGCLGFFAENLLRKRPDLFRTLASCAAVLLAWILFQTFWYLPFWKDSPTLARWAVYSYELPNDRFLLIHAKTGLTENNSVPVREAVNAFRKKIGSSSEDGDSPRILAGRRGAADALDIAASILEADFDGAVRKYDAFVGSGRSVLLLDGYLYEAKFKYLLMQLFVIRKDERRLDHFVKWASEKQDSSAPGGIRTDYTVTAFYKFHRKDYAGAAADWEEEIRLSGENPELRENIRRAREKLTEAR